MSTTDILIPATQLKPAKDANVVAIASTGARDTALVGGKGANLGEMLAAGLPVPPGVVITTHAYATFVESNELADAISRELDQLDPDDTIALDATSARLRKLVNDAPLPEALVREIDEAFAGLAGAGGNGRVAVRSSATAEDGTTHSFAGMFESVLNVGTTDALHDAVKTCWASTFGARALFYRAERGLPLAMAVAVVVQQMIDAEKSGVMFTADPTTREASRVVIEVAWGLGESVVQGSVTPDRYVLEKGTLRVLTATVAAKEFMLRYDPATKATEKVDLANDPRSKAAVLNGHDLAALGDLARRAEEHYGKPQDMEFAIVGEQVFLTQTRPVTTLGAPDSRHGAVLARGQGASPGRASGAVCVLHSSADEAAMRTGEVLVATMTSPDWVPVMRRAAAIVTDAGGMTSHAAIVARELGVPCVVGTHDATRTLTAGTIVTVDGRSGTVTAGADAPAPSVVSMAPAPSAARIATATRIYVNLAEPSAAAATAALDVDGVGLLRAEFMLVAALERMHPRKFVAKNGSDLFVSRMAEALRTFAEAFAPRPVIYRAMDFRSNEFRGLIGGAAFEPTEANPMIGYRGCFRYTREPDLFALELRALAEVRKQHDNVHLMIPFVRTPGELGACLALVDASPLAADRHLERWIMAEVPSVLYWLPKYAELGIDGVSIGSNDLTQLMLGVDRDSSMFGPEYDERDGAVLDAIHAIVTECRALGLRCSICGQAPSAHPEYAEQLVAWGIDSISVSPDAVDRTRHNVAAAEQRLLVAAARSGIDHTHTEE